jgi:hypothetical protein
MGDLLQTLADPSGNPQSSSRFGSAISMNSGLAAVGAPDADIDGHTDSGCAYVVNTNTGALVATLRKPNPAAWEYFRRSVAISGSRVAVGAWGDSTWASLSGMAYVFDAITGTLVATLVNPTHAPLDHFGYWVDDDEGNAIVGTPYKDTSGVDCGAVYVFDLNRPPVADAGGPCSVDEGNCATLTAAGSSDPDLGDTLTYAWDLDHNGSYTLVIDGSKIQSAGSVTGATDHFYRLFGGSDGDRDVDTVDHLAILKALSGRGSNPALNAAMDCDGGGNGHE